MRLKDKVVIVTGGAKGIGRAYCLGAAAEGGHVVVADIADPTPTVKEIEALGAQALGVACDVSREDDTQRLATETLARPRAGGVRHPRERDRPRVHAEWREREEHHGRAEAGERPGADAEAGRGAG